MSNLTAGHTFGDRKKQSTGEPMCDLCGLVWKNEEPAPAINCPRQPLGLLNIEWVEKYT